jgi:hypothetical protein
VAGSVEEGRVVAVSSESRRVGGRWPRGWRLALTIGLCFAVALPIASVLSDAIERITLRIRFGVASPTGPVESDNRMRFYAPGIERPPVHQAQDSRLSDEENIIGVEVEGRFRAYRTSAMLDRYNHIINDMIDEHPISITYCSMNDIAAAFTSGRLGAPLSISQGGLLNRHMIICVGEAEYVQDTLEPYQLKTPVPAFPYEPIPLVRTTWKQWREMHPETDAYEGLPFEVAGSAKEKGPG